MLFVLIMCFSIMMQGTLLLLFMLLCSVVVVWLHDGHPVSSFSNSSINLLKILNVINYVAALFGILCSPSEALRHPHCTYDNLIVLRPSSETALEQHSLGAFIFITNKKLSYRRETARQLPTSREGGLQSTLPPLATPMRMVESESHNVRMSSVLYCCP